MYGYTRTTSGRHPATREMNNIITPTFTGHFPNVKVYLESFSKYAAREDGWQIVFTISADEEAPFLKLIDPYEKTLPIKVILFEDLLRSFNIEESPDELLRIYGKFSFQTLKKFYTMLALDGRYSLVLDSETELVRPTSINSLFERFFADPFISYSSLEVRRRISTFTKNVVANRNYIFNVTDHHWFLENFVWFYDKKILIDLFTSYGQPIDIVEKIRVTGNPARKECGIFEIDLYQSYIFLNKEKYRYRTINVERFLDDLNEQEREKYLNDWTEKFEGNCGLMEHTPILLTQSNVDILANRFVNAGFNIIRCERSSFKNCEIQKRFLAKVGPNILAASQDHFFGLSPLIEKNNKYAVRSRDAMRIWRDQLYFLAGLVINPLKALIYLVKSISFNRRLAAFRRRNRKTAESRHD